MAGGVYETLNTAIRTRVISELQTGLPILCRFDNQSKPHTPNARWLRAAIVHEETEQIQVGALNRYRMQGYLEFEVHVPAADGTHGAREVAVAITTGFRGVTASSVVYRAPEHVGADQIGSEWVMLYKLPFYSDFDEAPQERISQVSAPNRDTVYDILVEHFKAQVQTAAAHLTKSFFFDNFESPPAAGSWARVSIFDGDSEHQDSGGPAYRTEGVIVCETFVPVADGSLAQIELVDDIAKAFRAISVKGVTCRTPRARTVTSNAEVSDEAETGRTDSVWQMNVVCPFHFSDT